ncbi:MAG: hypothetical protein RBR59_07310 [Sulfurimonadaceae bacterium]|jgi:hypothetical protein|nr:hypothetical protein [Sulfurimonadaceae bacterium]
MVKNLLLTFIFIFFAACSKSPEPETVPHWYTSPPVDYEYFYAVGIGNDASEAKNNALSNFRTSLIETLDIEFKRSNHRLGYLDENVLAVISRANDEIVNTLFIRNVSIEASTVFNFKTLLLLKIERQDIFKYADLASSSKLASVKKSYDMLHNLPDLQKYMELKILISDFAKLAAYTQLKELSISTFNASEDFKNLRNIYESLMDLRANITFYVLSDANSIGFVNFIKEGIAKESLALHSKMRDDNSYKVLITSASENSIDYSFMQSKTVLQAKLYNAKGEQVAQKQHTFIGKSRKSHKDAKEQATLSLKSKITKIGFFDFVGLNPRER